MSMRPVLLSFTLLLLACPGPGQQRPDGGSIPDAGTGTPDAGPPALLQLEGPLELAPGVEVPADLRVGVLWFSSIDTSAPSRPRAAESGPSMGAVPPARWKLELMAEPPQSARADFQSPGGGSGVFSVGALVLFRDADGDGRLTVAQDGSSSDELLGSSAGAMPFDVDGPGQRTLVVWRSGTIGPDETGFAKGFNLVTLDEPFARPVVVPATSAVTLRLSRDPRLRLTFCADAFAVEPPETACGQLVFRTPRVTAVIVSAEGVLFATVRVESGPRALKDARVLLNGVVMPSDGEDGYVLFELMPVVLKYGVNRLRVEAAGFEPLSLDLVLPRAPTLLTPAANAELPARAPVNVTWNAGEGATTYDVSITAESGEATFGTSTTNELALEAPSATGPATIRLTAMAQGAVPRHVTIGTVDATTLDVRVVAP